MTYLTFFTPPSCFDETDKKSSSSGQTFLTLVSRFRRRNKTFSVTVSVCGQLSFVMTFFNEPLLKQGLLCPGSVAEWAAVARRTGLGKSSLS